MNPYYFISLIFTVQQLWALCSCEATSGKRHKRIHEEAQKACREILKTSLQSSEFRNVALGVYKNQAKLSVHCTQSEYLSYFDQETNTCVDCNEKTDCNEDSVCVANCKQKIQLVDSIRRLEALERDVNYLWIIAIVLLVACIILFASVVILLLCTYSRNKGKGVRTDHPDADQPMREDGPDQESRAF